MAETSASLLERVRDGTDSAWHELANFYAPFIRGWLRGQHALDNDFDDIAQEVLIVVVRKLPTCQRERPGSFRSWLRQITIHCVRQFWRSRRAQPFAPADSAFWRSLHELEDPGSSLSRQWERDHDRHVTRCLLERIRSRFEPQTWTAFHCVAIDGMPASQVAEKLGITVNAVFIAKSRVMTLLRQEGAGLLDE